MLKSSRPHSQTSLIQMVNPNLISGPNIPTLPNLVTDAPAHPTATQVYEYIAAYAKHFNLLPHVQLNTPIQWVKRNPTNTQWRVCFGSGEYEGTRDFDKVVFCSGLTTKAVTPEFEGMEKFKGKMIHCQAFKRYLLCG